MRAPRRRIVLFGRTSDADATTLADILRQETVGGVLMLVAAAVALIWANLGPHGYEAVREWHLGPLSLEHWASDGLLTIFFFVAGLELKRELTVGSLSKPSEALVPIVAAVCGMAVPAALYLVINFAASTGQPQGWPIPMATDIAFALAILAVAAPGRPTSLRAFLLTLAIVDDLGAILVIATVFTEHIALVWLLGGLAVAVVWWVLQRRRIRGWYLYVPLAVICWICVWQSGVHPTISGVALGLLTRSSATDPHAPVDAWEHTWRPISAGVAVPIFALLAAGVAVTGAGLVGLIAQPVALGVIIGLVAGKAIGIFGGAYLTARLTRAELAPDLCWFDVFGVAVLGGVGFTVALLVAELAFTGHPELQDQAKTAVLVASLLAAVLAAVVTRLGKTD